MNEVDENKLLKVIMDLTPLSQYDNLADWYDKFKKKMRKEMKK